MNNSKVDEAELKKDITGAVAQGAVNAIHNNESLNADDSFVAPEIPVVHLSKKDVTRFEEKNRAFPLSESDMPFSDGTVAGVHRVIDFLNVEKSLRYKRTHHATFCNIYAHDYAFLMHAFLPRIYWNESTIRTKRFECEYGVTVHELNANELYGWFDKYGAQYGWSQVANISDAQVLANKGQCVIMTTANKDRTRSGHILAIVPETDDCKAIGSGGIYISPVQSQAGAVNKKYFSSFPGWWDKMEPYKIYVNNQMIINS